MKTHRIIGKNPVDQQIFSSFKMQYQFRRKQILEQYIIFYTFLCLPFLLFSFKIPTVHLNYIQQTHMRITIQKQEIQIGPKQIKRKIGIQKNGQAGLSYLQQDIHFPETLTSIGTDIRTDLNIEWKSVQQLCSTPKYSEGISNLQITEYCNNSITEALLILNWFVPNKFAQIFSERVVSKIRTYDFIVYISGRIYKLFINSKVPLKDNKILFAEPLNNSIFPSVFQKVIAKSYGSYENIPENLVSILELFTGYAVQSFAPHQHSAQQFVEFFEDSFVNNNLVFFRTRNSVRLQSAGMLSNKIYVIARYISMQQAILVEFLELGGENWKGKYSKESAVWANKKAIVNEHKINLQKGRQNYISLKDLLGISRQVIILHNTQKYNQNWISSSSQNFNHTFKLNPKGAQISHLMMQIHFNRKKCRSCAYLICSETCQLISGNFKEKKDTNFIAAIINPNYHYYLFVYCEDQETKPLSINITIYTSEGWCEIEQIQVNSSIEERAFLQFTQNLAMHCTYLSEQQSKKNVIRVKNLYNEFGLGVIVISLQPQFNKNVIILIEKQKLLEHGIQPINHRSERLTYQGPCKAILLFKIKGMFKEKNLFPPKDAIKVFLGPKKIIIQSLFS